MNGLTGRLLKLADLLQSHTRLTTEELAERLSISKRTVRRDIVRLQDLELNVEVTPGRGGGVTLQPGSLLPALRFTDDEALAIGFGLLLAGRTERVALGRAPKSASARLGSVARRTAPRAAHGARTSCERTLNRTARGYTRR